MDYTRSEPFDSSRLVGTRSGRARWYSACYAEQYKQCCPKRDELCRTRQIMTENTKPEPSESSLLTEYQATQDSAQHHDNLVWSVTSIMWGATLVLMGFIFSSLKEVTLRPLIMIVSTLGIALTIAVWVFALQLNSVKRQKYARCKEIEHTLHLRQHSTLRWTGGSQRIIYGVLMGIIIMIWIAILWTVWTNKPPATGDGSQHGEPPRLKRSVLFTPSSDC